MPWLSIFIALLNYLLASKNTPKERRNALLGSLAAGAGTYAVTHYTDWGKEALGKFDGVTPVGSALSSLPADATNAAVAAELVKPTTTQASSMTTSVAYWAKTAGIVYAGKTAIDTTSTALKNPISWLIIGVAAIFILKD